MWLFTRHGFYSITRSREEPDKLQIRARDRQHLVELKLLLRTEEGTDMLGPILETPAADYGYRIMADAETVQIVQARLCDDIQYFNFKNAAHAQPRHDGLYGRALSRVWSIMYRLQHRDPAL